MLPHVSNIPCGYNNLYLGIDTENDYNRSQWKENSKNPMRPSGDYDGELMMLLEVAKGQ